jgi:membrane-associated phospholipid phosphatase
MKRLFAVFLAVSMFVSSTSFANDTSEIQQWESRSDRAGDWLLHDLPRHIGNDFKYAFWNPWHLLFLATGVGATAGIHQADKSIQEAFVPEDPMGGAADVFDVMGRSYVLGGATLTAFAISKLVDARKAALTSGTMFEAFSLTMALTFGLKFATQRTRPDGSNDRSFPSGHASGAFALATVAEVFHGPLYGIPSYLLASTIALSRIDLNKHWASDTVAGAVLGTLIGLGTAKFHKKEFSQFFLVPTVDERSAGISLIHQF